MTVKHPHPNPSPSQGEGPLISKNFDLEAFVAQFPVFARAPGGIANLRGLILQLAVQGKLISTPSLDKKYKETYLSVREKSIDSGSLKKNRGSQTSIITSEQPDNSGWCDFTLDELFCFIDYRGKTPQKTSSGIPLITAKNIRSGYIDREPREFIASEDYDDWMTRGFPATGDLLFTTEAPMGNVAVIDISEKFALAQRCITLKPYGELDSRFIMFYMMSRWFQNELETNATGMTAKGIKSGKLLKIKIYLPPLEEQKRIVAKVDELMALCNQLETQQDAQALNLLAANTSATQALMQAGDDFDQHWQRIATHFNTLYGCNLPLPAAMNKGKLKDRTVALENVKGLRESILKLAMDGKLSPINPTKTKLGKVVLFQNGYAFKSSWYQSSGVKLARNANVSHGTLDWTDDRYVSKEIAEEYSRFQLSAGDLLLSLDRPIISTGVKMARVRKEDLPCLLLQRVAKAVFDESEVSPQFLELWFKSPAYSESIDPGRSNGVPHISTKQLSQMAFKLPALAEQKAIVSKVTELLTLCDHLETLLNQQRQLTTEFSQSTAQTATA